MRQGDFTSLIERFRDRGVKAIVLMGSYARGDEGAFSDVDLCRFMEADGPDIPASTCLIDGVFVVVSHVTPSQVELTFADPDRATAGIAGLRSGRGLWDPTGHFRAIQERAMAFVWDAAMQAKADAWAGGQMVGWIEEVHKGLEGLRRGDTGRLLNARFGLSWGLAGVMRVQRGVLIHGDNGSVVDVIDHIGADSPWAELLRGAFGIAGGGLAEHVRAGLRLYVLTAEFLSDILQPDEKALVEETVRRINGEVQCHG